jgi:membrane-associated phospholipid phosphatase
VLAVTVTVLIGLGVWLEPYFAGDVTMTRALQAFFPDPWWATPISRIAAAPSNYFVMGLTIGLSYALAGWKGPLIAAAAILLDQYGSDATKTIFSRPRPSHDLVTVVGSTSGFSFPSGTVTFFCATFGLLAVLAARAKASSMRWIVLLVSSMMIVLACAARVVLGAHWPSDVILTTIVCVMWLWVTVRTTG